MTTLLKEYITQLMREEDDFREGTEGWYELSWWVGNNLTAIQDNGIKFNGKPGYTIRENDENADGPEQFEIVVLKGTTKVLAIQTEEDIEITAGNQNSDKIVFKLENGKTCSFAV